MSFLFTRQILISVIAYLTLSTVFARERVALVIANEGYRGGEANSEANDWPRLSNPVRDGRLLAERLSQIGFTVDVRENLTSKQMLSAIGSLLSRGKDADAVLLFYTGHGAGMDGENFLIPVDARYVDEIRANVKRDGVPLQHIVSRLSELKKSTKIVLIDACRDLPVRYKGADADGGLVSPAYYDDVVIGFAADTGKSARDNGVYVKGLLAGLSSDTPNLANVLATAERHVRSATADLQKPRIWGGPAIMQDFWFTSSGRPPKDLRITELEREKLRLEQEVREYKEKLLAASKPSSNVNASLPISSVSSTSTVPAKLSATRLSGTTKMGMDEGAYPKEDSVRSPSANLAINEDGAIRRMDDILQVEGCRECGELIQIPDGTHKVSEGKSIKTVPIRRFEISRTVITQAQWQAIMGNNPSAFKHCGLTCPVENITWNNVQEFIKKLNQRTGKKYRLATFYEWDYAMQAGAEYQEAPKMQKDVLQPVGWICDKSRKMPVHAVCGPYNSWNMFLGPNVTEYLGSCMTFTGDIAEGRKCKDDNSYVLARGLPWSAFGSDASLQTYVLMTSYDKPSKEVGFRLARSLP